MIAEQRDGTCLTLIIVPHSAGPVLNYPHYILLHYFNLL